MGGWCVIPGQKELLSSGHKAPQPRHASRSLVSTLDKHNATLITNYLSSSYYLFAMWLLDLIFFLNFGLVSQICFYLFYINHAVSGVIQGYISFSCCTRITLHVTNKTSRVLNLSKRGWERVW